MKNRICIPITASTVEQAISELKVAEKSADIVELRIDFIKGIDNNKLRNILKNKKKKIIVTCRPKKINGNFSGNENKRISLLKKAIELNVDFIDIEIDSDKKIIKDIIKNEKNTKIIVSYHNFKETPSLEKLKIINEKMKKLNPDLIKIVAFANSINDNFEIFKLLKNKKDLISFCMGLRGQISRILAPKYGSYLTFASLQKDKESASGQITIEEMSNTYNIQLVNQKTKVLGVIGEFAENSMSKYMHNACFKQKKMNLVYMPFKVRKSELGIFMKNFRDFEFRGSSITIPYKVGIIKYANEIDETAQKIGAVNTLVNKNGKITAYNTDYYGAVQALKEKTNLDNKKVLVIGAGGAARAVIYGLKKENAEITVTNRTIEKAKNLADEFNTKVEGMKNMKELIEQNDIIINTTSVGMNPNTNKSVIKDKEFVKGKIVMDIVYKPTKTKLISIAKKSKCETITGDRMLIYQAIEQFKLWTGKEPEFKLMESALSKQIKTER